VHNSTAQDGSNTIIPRRLSITISYSGNRVGECDTQGIA